MALILPTAFASVFRKSAVFDSIHTTDFHTGD